MIKSEIIKDKKQDKKEIINNINELYRKLTLNNYNRTYLEKLIIVCDQVILYKPSQQTNLDIK
jgi:hypothetical protein